MLYCSFHTIGTLTKTIQLWGGLRGRINTWLGECTVLFMTSQRANIQKYVALFEKWSNQNELSTGPGCPLRGWRHVMLENCEVNFVSWITSLSEQLLRVKYSNFWEQYYIIYYPKHSTKLHIHICCNMVASGAVWGLINTSLGVLSLTCESCKSGISTVCVFFFFFFLFWEK